MNKFLVLLLITAFTLAMDAQEAKEIADMATIAKVQAERKKNMPCVQKTIKSIEKKIEKAAKVGKYEIYAEYKCVGDDAQLEVSAYFVAKGYHTIYMDGDINVDWSQ